MANDVKWTDWRSAEIDDHQSPLPATEPTSAVLQLLGCVLGLVGLTVVLPGPGSWARLVSGIHAGTPGLVAVGAAAEAAILVIAAALAWALLVWVLAVWIAAVAGRLPGAPGRYGRAIVRRIAPAAAGRIIATAVGVSLLAGTSACAAPVMADLGSDPSAEVVSASTTASTPASLGGGAGVVDSATSTAPATSTTTAGVSQLDDVLASISIDWPAVAAPSSTVPPRRRRPRRPRQPRRPRRPRQPRHRR